MPDPARAPDALLDALTAAPAGSRELDAIVAEALGWKRVVHHGCSSWETPAMRYLFHLPLWTTNTDAALSLVPEGWRVSQVGEWDEPRLRECGPWLAIVAPADDNRGPLNPCWDTRCDHAPTMALAIVIAALRARAAGA